MNTYNVHLLNCKDIINKIERIRVEDNKNWMDILRLSFNLSPKRTAKLLSKIYREDQRISNSEKSGLAQRGSLKNADNFLKKVLY